MVEINTEITASNRKKPTQKPRLDCGLWGSGFHTPALNGPVTAPVPPSRRKSLPTWLLFSLNIVRWQAPSSEIVEKPTKALLSESPTRFESSNNGRNLPVMADDSDKDDTHTNSTCFTMWRKSDLEVQVTRCEGILATFHNTFRSQSKST